MTVISFLNQKGGCGRSTLSQNVAACLAFDHKVLLIDADKQGTSSTWASLRDECPFRVIAMARKNMAKDAIALAEGFEFTVIDGPPHADGVTRSCIIASDIVVVPIEPGGASRWSSNLTVSQLREAQEFKPSLKCGLVVSRKIGGTVLGREARAMAADAGMSLFRTEIKQRIAYAEAMTMGRTVFEWPGSSLATFDIQNLTQEIKETLDNGQELRNTRTKADVGRHLSL
jgi:chromosome partitioning protein